jgi:hypothetical protein
MKYIHVGWNIVKPRPELLGKFQLLARDNYRMAYSKNDLLQYIDESVLSKVRFNGKYYRNWYEFSD